MTATIARLASIGKRHDIQFGEMYLTPLGCRLFFVLWDWGIFHDAFKRRESRLQYLKWRWLS